MAADMNKLIVIKAGVMSLGKRKPASKVRAAITLIAPTAYIIFALNP